MIFLKVFLWSTTAIVSCTCIGCRDEQAKVPKATEKILLLYCGAGIQPPVDELAEIFSREHNIKIDINYAGSEVLLSTIKVNRRGDLYMPGDKQYIELAADEGLVLSSKTVCYFVPTILVRKGNPLGIAGLHDLLKPGVKLGLGDYRACAVGQVSKKIFDKNGIPWPEIEKNLKFQSLTVNELGMQIQAGALDAVIVWDAVARYYDEYGDLVPIDVERNIISTVDIGILSFSKDKETAGKFVDFATSERGQSIFKKHNYRVEPP